MSSAYDRNTQTEEQHMSSCVDCMSLASDLRKTTAMRGGLSPLLPSLLTRVLQHRLLNPATESCRMAPVPSFATERGLRI